MQPPPPHNHPISLPAGDGQLHLGGRDGACEWVEVPHRCHVLQWVQDVLLHGGALWDLNKSPILGRGLGKALICLDRSPNTTSLERRAKGWERSGGDAISPPFLPPAFPRRVFQSTDWDREAPPPCKTNPRGEPPSSSAQGLQGQTHQDTPAQALRSAPRSARPGRPPAPAGWAGRPAPPSTWVGHYWWMAPGWGVWGSRGSPPNWEIHKIQLSQGKKEGRHT